MKLSLAELGREPTTFVSPFPTFDAPEQLDVFDALLRQYETNTSAYFSMLQGDAWQQASHINNTAWLTSAASGGAPTDMLRRMLPNTVLSSANLEPSLVKGADLFASAVFTPTTSAQNMGKKLAEVGLSIALDASSAIPIVGKILGAVVGVAKALSKFSGQPRKKVEAQIPWFQWNKDFDQDMVNFLAKLVVPSVDWTTLWMPPLAAAKDFELRYATKMGPKALAWGTWTSGNQPDWGAGLGCMPGLQQGLGVMQCARISASGGLINDAVTNSMDYLPSATQQATAAWSMVTKFGSPLMFQVQPQHLSELWAAWWDGFFYEGLTKKQYKGQEYADLAVAKILARWMCLEQKGTWFIGLSPIFIQGAGNLDAFLDDLFSKDKNKLIPGRQIYTPAVLIKKACNDLVKAQIAALERTVVCALVRPEALSEETDDAAFAAFLDPGAPVKSLSNKGYNQNTYGKQLTAYAMHLRVVLKTHKARFTLNRNDVYAVDPAYADTLGPLFGQAQNFAAFEGGEGPGPGGPESEPQPPPYGPVGQPPFTWADKKKPKAVESNLGRNMAIGAAVVGGALAYKYRDELRSKLKSIGK